MTEREEKGKAGVSNMGGVRFWANCLPGPQKPFKQGTVDLVTDATKGAGGVFGQCKSDTVFRLLLPHRGRDSS